MAVVLHANSYGKSRIRLTKVTRHADRHDLTEWTVEVQLDGDFAAAYTAGDNRKVVATDTMKNRVYVLARDGEFNSPEEFALRYTGDFLQDYPQIETAIVQVTESSWQRINVAEAHHPTAFCGGPAGQRTCAVTQSRNGVQVWSGIADVPVLKTTDSAFRDFHRDEYTTLPDVDDRILATLLTADWRYAPGTDDWNDLHEDVAYLLLSSFAQHESLGAQQTLHDMGAAVLKDCKEVEEIKLCMPNRHRLLFNMQPFGRTNENQIFVTTDEPFGLISGHLKRS